MNKKKIVLASTLAVLIAPSVLGTNSNQTTTVKADDTNAETNNSIKNPIGTLDYGGAYAYDSNGNKLSLYLSGKSSWKLGKSVLINGQRFYGIGANEYVNSANITITDGMPPVLPTLVKEVYQGLVGTLGYPVNVVDMYGNPTGRVLQAGSSWKLGNLYVLKDGNTYYKISTSEYALASVITPSSTTSSNTTSNVGVLGYDAKVVDANGTYTGITLPAGSSWQLGQFVTIGNNGYYQVATNEYVLATIINSTNYSFNATLRTNISVYNSSTNSLTRTLPAGSSWKITTVLRNKNNEFWGKVATNEWIKIDDNLDTSYGASDSVPSIAISEPEFATSIIK